jgi:uncharacterized membrane protein
MARRHFPYARTPAVRHTTRVSEPYNRFAGGDRERVGALSDGVFAVAMTLLVLDLRVPVGAAHNDRQLWDSLRELGPGFAAYLLSFTMLGTFWLAQHALLSLASRTDRTLTWLQIGFLVFVSLLPFTASLLAEHLTVRLAVGVYWLDLLLLGLGLAASCRHLRRSGLVDSADAERLVIFRRRIAAAQVGYGLAALVCLLDTYASVAALAAVQLYFIVSPRIPALDRLLLPGDRTS